MTTYVNFTAVVVDMLLAACVLHCYSFCCMQYMLNVAAAVVICLTDFVKMMTGSVGLTQQQVWPTDHLSHEFTKQFITAVNICRRSPCCI